MNAINYHSCKKLYKKNTGCSDSIYNLSLQPNFQKMEVGTTSFAGLRPSCRRLESHPEINAMPSRNSISSDVPLSLGALKPRARLTVALYTRELLKCQSSSSTPWFTTRLPSGGSKPANPDLADMSPVPAWYFPDQGRYFIGTCQYSLRL